MFQPDTSWSLPAHLFMVSEWSARCSVQQDPMSCVNALENPLAPPHEIQNPTGQKPDYAWTDLTYLLHRHHVSWRYYVFAGDEPDCETGAMVCAAIRQRAKTPRMQNSSRRACELRLMRDAVERCLKPPLGAPRPP